MPEQAKTCAAGTTGQLTDSWQLRSVVDRAVERARGMQVSESRLAEIAERGRKERAALAAKLLADDLGVRYGQARASLGNYVIYDGRQKQALADIRAFLSDLPRRVESGSGLILFGAVGTGKDHLLAAALHHAAASGYSCRWANAQELYGTVRDRMDAGSSEAEWFRTWATPQILGLSDPTPPAGELSAWRTELLYRLVDRRYRAMKSTWVTVNVASAEDADKRLSAPVFDRLQEGAVLVPCFWQSQRERKG